MENFRYGDLHKVLDKYNPAKLQEGFNIVNGEEYFFISNPALGVGGSAIKCVHNTLPCPGNIYSSNV